MEAKGLLMSDLRGKAGSDVLLTAKECAARIGLTVRGLRLYESRGLISPRRTAKSWRLYGAAEISRLHEILALKRMGLSLAQIAKLLEGRAIDLDRTLAMQQASILALRNRADEGLALVNAARSKLTRGGSLSIADLIALARETNMAEASFDAVAQRRYEQARPRTAVQIDPRVMDRYVGHFRFEGGAQAGVGTIARDGDRLFAKLIGQPALEMFAESDCEFFLKTAIPVQVTFVVEPDGTANTLVLHHSGVEQKASRIDDEQARGAMLDLARKIDDKMPSPGSQAAIRRLITQYQQGAVDYAGMSASLAAVAREQAPLIAAELALAGGLQTMRFRGVGRDGWDVYDANFANGDMECRIALGPDGRIEGVCFRPLP
jgi:DNA-binding transcriptional MerR regulator